VVALVVLLLLVVVLELLFLLVVVVVVMVVVLFGTKPPNAHFTLVVAIADCKQGNKCSTSVRTKSSRQHRFASLITFGRRGWPGTIIIRCSTVTDAVTSHCHRSCIDGLCHACNDDASAMFFLLLLSGVYETS
jgi:hypothetical protein